MKPIARTPSWKVPDVIGWRWLPRHVLYVARRPGWRWWRRLRCAAGRHILHPEPGWLGWHQQACACGRATAWLLVPARPLLPQIER